MKYQLVPAAILLSVMSFQSVNAAAGVGDGTINFTGALVAQTCAVSVNSSTGASAVVALPHVSINGMSALGVAKGDTALNFSLTNCATGAGAATKAAIYFQQNNTSVNSDGSLMNTAQTAAAGGVALQILDSFGNKVAVGHAEQSAQQFTPITNVGALSYIVQYVATGPVTAGAFVSNVTYSVNYQ